MGTPQQIHDSLQDQVEDLTGKLDIAMEALEKLVELQDIVRRIRRV